MDEKLMMREQERLAREKKKKKNRKKLRIVGIVLVAVVAVGVWYIGWGRNLGNKEADAVQIVISSGQEIIYADLTSVKGNEITYLVAHQMEETEDSSREKRSGERPQMPDMGDRGGFGGGRNRGMGQNGFTASEKETFTYNNVTYEVTEESVTTFIPVGCDVTTKLGTVTTFSRLAAGDKVALVMEEVKGEQIIVAVYIIG